MTGYELLGLITAWVSDVCDTPVGPGITVDEAVRVIRTGQRPGGPQ